MSFKLHTIARLNQAFEYLARRAGTLAVYKRFKEETYHPTLGRQKTFWEVVQTFVIPIEPSQATIQLPEGISGRVGSIFAVRRSAFRLQPGESPPLEPKAGDEIVIGDEVWTADLEGRVYFSTDPTGELWFIAMRRL